MPLAKPQPAVEPEPPVAAPPWVAPVQRRVHRYLRCLRCPRDLVEDFVQEALLIAVRERGGQAPPLPWMLTVARNLWLLHCRRDARAPSPEELQRLHARAIEQLGADGGDDAVEALRLCVAALPERSRLALQLCYRDGMSRTEAAARLGMGDEGMKSMLARLRAALRACIERRRRQP